jgi:hypothetical protein
MQQLEIDFQAIQPQDDNLIRLMLQPPRPLVHSNVVYLKLERYRRDHRPRYKA